jgi:hypothetical protein
MRRTRPERPNAEGGRMARDHIDLEKNIFRAEMRITSLRALIADQKSAGSDTTLSELSLDVIERSVAELWRARSRSK